MALKAVLDTLEGLDESLHGLYKEADGKFYLDLEGVEEHPSTKGLKVVLEDQKKKTKAEHAKVVAATEALKAFDDLDPEEAREALKKLQELGDKDRIDQGEFKQLLEDRVAEVTAKLERTNAARLAELQKTNDVLVGERDDATGSLSRHKIGDVITAAALESGIKKSLLRHLKRDAMEVFTIRDGEIGAWDEDDILRTDSKGGALTPATYVTDYLTDNPDFVDTSRGSGAGGPGDSRGGNSGTARFISQEQAADNIEDIASGKAIIQD